ncbi:hypothetical protein [Bacillus seohaeanensis]|jgi:hypothetical protein|uniref:Uncharacterized protein n=1 Tax=Bacillus seohaeanensis TaxID=284580 RepID=A0ABW5RPB1_9BACI
MKEKTFLYLLNSYRSLWNNRQLGYTDSSAEAVLKEAIKRDLLDENSHPRIRKNKEEKYYLAIKRIIESSLHEKDKLQLIQLYTESLTEFR